MMEHAMRSARERVGFYREILKLAECEFASRGFRKAARAIFVRELPGRTEALGWLGLNRSGSEPDGTHFLNPFVGIHHFAVEQVLRALLPESAHRRRSDATVVVPLIQLVPGGPFKHWGFTPAADNVSTMRDLVDHVWRYGVPFMDDMLEPSKLVDIAAGSEPPETKLPAVLLALGQVTEAQEIIARELDRIRDEDGAWREFYGHFASNAARYVASHSQ